MAGTRKVSLVILDEIRRRTEQIAKPDIPQSQHIEADIIKTLAEAAAIVTNIEGTTR